jgi:hypothetical protein
MQQARSGKAVNPKTGKPINIIHSEGAAWRNAKTLVWMTGETAPIKTYERWETGVVGLENLKAWSQYMTPDVVVLPTVTHDAVEWVRSGQWRKHRLVFLTKEIVDEFETEADYVATGINNAICLEEILDIYPFVERAWDGTEDDAKVLIALLLRMSATFPVSEASTNHRATAIKYGLTVSSHSNFLPPFVTLITQYYTPSKPKRAREIRDALQKNIDCPFIDSIILLNETSYGSKLPTSPKIKEEVIGSRLTYADVLKYITDEVPENNIVIFANSDIYFDESLRLLYSMNLDDTFLSLLRYEVAEDGSSKLFGPRPDSQDSWIVLSDAVKSRTWEWSALDFPFGKPGCDNAINVEMLRKKFLVVNPALSIKTYHLHRSGVREYDPRDIVDKPIYLYVHPTGLHDMQPAFTIDRTHVKKFLELEPFQRRVGAEHETFCKMVGREGAFKLSPSGRNMWPEVDKRVSLFRFDDCFQTSRGLPYGYNTLWLGRSPLIADGWASTETSTLTPCLASKSSFAVYLSPEAAADPVKYMLEYLGKVFWMREDSGWTGASFWAPESEAFVELLSCFVWPTKSVPVVKWSPQSQIYSRETLFWYPQNEYQMSREEVFALREFTAVKYQPAMDLERPRVVVVVDGHITDEWVATFEAAVGDRITVEVIYPSTAPHRVMELLAGAAGAVVYGGKDTHARWGWFWMLPRDATVYEIQNDLDPSADLLHMVAAAGGRHQLTVVGRGAAAAAAAAPKVAAAFCATTGACEVDFTAATAPPTILVPAKEGFFSHAGDSFREMVDLWAERGYVKKVVDETVHNIWMGGAGETLLYDRPTYEWLQLSPAREQVWKRALFGNPAPFGTGSTAWSFWPRRPRLVEELAAAGAAGWKERKNLLVFYGKIENAVQDKHRRGGGEDWSYICDDFQLVVGEATPYKFTQRQYLEALAAARFGLCLAGYGKKCHREVECMAMGCVPVVAPEVDMTHYAEPPQEGIHYIRVKNPADAYERVNSITADEWKLMSDACRTWWRRNASCDGMWELTKRLATST